uniref:F-box/LRR-repeat protein 15/At3g58940/PEG3-like LRR domain-containing protein n=2 Tax=Aegilops tauschii TaxID=37682 RepID=A0A453FQT4_AEGTS
AIHQLHLTFYLRDESIDIVRAVEGAIARGRGIVGRAGFTMLGEKITYTSEVTDLVAQGARLLSYLGACPRAFAALTHLHVESVKLRQPDVSNLLDRCKKLKHLSLQNLDCGKEVVLRIQHPELTQLKLVMCFCDSFELKWLPELEELTIGTWCPSKRRDPVLFGHAPRLSKLTACNGYNTRCRKLKLSEFLRDANMRELHMNFDTEMPWFQMERPEQLAPRLKNLRILKLDNINEECSVTWTLFLLEAAPLLEKLHIKVSNHECESFEDEMLRKLLVVATSNIEFEPSDFKHYKLAVLTIYGFQPGDMFMQYMRRVMEAAVNLEEISLHDHWCEECDFYPLTRYPKTDQDRELIREEINRGRPSPMRTIQVLFSDNKYRTDD